MKRTRTRMATGAAVVIAALAGGGGAIAATSGDTPQEESTAILDDAASRLGVDSAKLNDALEQAYSARIDERVAAGELTQSQADELKAKLAAGDVPLLGLRGPGGPGDHGRHGGPGGIGHSGETAATTYLGLTETALHTQLEAGQTLAQVAAAQGKTVAGLKEAMTAAITKDLDAAVADGRMTEAQKTAALADLSARLDERINSTRPERGPGGAPPADDAAAPATTDAAA